MKPEIVIHVSAYWEKRTGAWPKEVEWKPECEFSGGWDITKCVGHPEINGGCCSPDFTATPESIKADFIRRYTDYFNNTHTITVKMTVIKDERNPTMENFF